MLPANYREHYPSTTNYLKAPYILPLRRSTEHRERITPSKHCGESKARTYNLKTMILASYQLLHFAVLNMPSKCLMLQK